MLGAVQDIVADFRDAFGRRAVVAEAIAFICIMIVIWPIAITFVLLEPTR